MDWLPLKCMGLEYRVARNGVMGFHRYGHMCCVLCLSLSFPFLLLLPGCVTPDCKMRCTWPGDQAALKDSRAPFVVRAEAKLINCPFSPLTLASLLRMANIGSSTAHPPPNHVVHFNQAKLIRAIARARFTSKGRKGRSPKQ